MRNTVTVSVMISEDQNRCNDDRYLICVVEIPIGTRFGEPEVVTRMQKMAQNIAKRAIIEKYKK